ncbi:MAG: hypothetical protein JRM80_12200 [Nitrososphaerota archaeon]|nr:hypothetical protein [Nitrososphaerota archaeon]
MKPLLVVGMVFLLVGGIMAVFGAVYTVRTSDTVGTFYGYPIWVPLVWALSFGASISANYTLNLIGVALILLGVAALVRGRGESPKVNGLTLDSEKNRPHGPST